MVAFLSGAVLTAANLNSAFNALTFRAVTGTSDTFVLADNGGAVSYSNASPITATVPPFSSVAYANGTTIELLNLGAGVVTVTAGAGVTLNGSSVAIAQNAGGTLIKTATNTWYFLPSSTGSGMDLITPTSVAGSGVTVSGGQVTFTAATEVAVNGCFTSAYENYRLVFEGTQSTGTTVGMRLRAAGSNAAGSNYTFQVLTSSGASASGISTTGTNFDYLAVGNTVSMMSETIVRRPNLAETTQISSLGGRSDYVAVVTGYHTLTTQYDGLALLSIAGNMTGKLRIYGMRNS